MKKILFVGAVLLQLICFAQSNYQLKLFHSTPSGTCIGTIYSNEYGNNTVLIRHFVNSSSTLVFEVSIYTTATGSVSSSQRFSLAGSSMGASNAIIINHMLYILAFSTSSSNSFSYVIKYNLNTHTVVWETRLPVMGEAYSHIAWDHYKNLYLLGNVFNTSANKGDLVLTRVDTNGVCKWIESFGDATSHQSISSTGIICNNPKYIYVTGKKAPFSSFSSIMKLDSVGVVIDSKALIVNNNPRFYKSFLAPLDDKLVLVNRTTDTMTYLQGPIVSVLLDTTLNIIHSRVIAPNIYLTSVFGNNTGVLLSGGSIGTRGFKSIRFDSLLNISGSRYFNKLPFGLQNVSNTYSFKNSTNTSIHFFSPYQGDTVFVVKTDQNEITDCQDSVYNVNNTSFNYSITVSAASNYTYSFWGINSSTTSIPLSNVNYQSFLLCEATAGINTIAENPLISVYPNPVNSVLNFNLGTTTSSNFKITDVTGKEMISGSSQNNIDVSSFKAGIYFISVYNSDKQLLGVKKFMKE